MAVVIRWMAFVIGILATVVLVMSVIQTARFLAVSNKVQAVVMDIKGREAYCERSASKLVNCKGTKFTATLKYEVDGVTYWSTRSAGGQTKTPLGMSRVESASYQIGEAIPLLYDVRQHRRIKDIGLFGIWDDSLFLLLIATICFLVFRKKRPVEIEEPEFDDSDPVVSDTNSVRVEPIAASVNTGDPDHEDREFALRYGTRTDSEDGIVAPKRHAYPTRVASPLPPRSSETKGSFLTREHDAIDVTPTASVRFLGFLLGLAAFLVSGYCAITIFVLDNSPDNKLSILIKTVLFVVILLVSALAARWTYLALTVGIGIFRRLFRKA